MGWSLRNRHLWRQALRLAPVYLALIPNAHSALRSSDTASPTYFLGLVGIGTASPVAALDVNGAIRAGSSAVVTVACASGTEGMQRYNYSSHAIEFCNGTNWLQLPVLTTGTTTPVTASGPPVGANIYAYTISASYSPTYGSLSNLNNGVWPPNGTGIVANTNCVSLYNGVTGAGQLITLDLGAVRTINNVYASISGGYNDMNLGISFSTDNSTYANSTTISANSGTGQAYYVPFALTPNVTARYVRLNNSAPQTDPGYGNYQMICQFAVGP